MSTTWVAAPLPMEFGMVAVLLSLHINESNVVGGVLFPLLANHSLVWAWLGLCHVVQRDGSSYCCYVNGIEIGDTLVELSNGNFVACWVCGSCSTGDTSPSDDLSNHDVCLDPPDSTDELDGRFHRG